MLELLTVQKTYNSPSIHLTVVFLSVINPSVLYGALIVVIPPMLGGFPKQRASNAESTFMPWQHYEYVDIFLVFVGMISSNILCSAWWSNPASLALSEGNPPVTIHRSPVDSPHKGPVIRKALPCHDVIDLLSGMAVINSSVLYGALVVKAPHHWPFVRGIHRSPVDYPHKGPVIRNVFPCHDIIDFLSGMGVINSSVLYGALVISCLIVPRFLINLIGHKWTIPLSFCGYIAWMAANGYAVWGTMVTASILVGFAAAPLWTAQCSYFTILAQRYAQINREDEGTVVTRFFGIFFFFFQVCKYFNY